MARTLRHSAIPLFILACLLLGGSTQGVWRNFLLQALGGGFLLWALLGRQRTTPTRDGRFLFILCAAWFLLVAIQLVPLPPSLWSTLPGRELAVQSFTLRGEPLPWLPLSLAPAETAATLPVLLVPLAILAGMLLLGAYRTRWCVAALLTGVLVSVLLGALQLSGGGPYLYPIHNDGATGLFANSNHQGTLLLIAIPFLAAMIGQERASAKGPGKEGVSRIAIALGGLVVVVIGVALNGSLAALALLLPVGLASIALAWPGRRQLSGLLGGLTLLLLLAGAGALALRSDAGTSDTGFTSRADIYQRTSQAIADSFPVGTGLGSFDTVYRPYEDPAKVDRWFVNNAHSDPLEWVLEMGLPGLLLLLAFLVWWARRARRLWLGDGDDLPARAAVVACAAILAHSLVDYPLRNPAIQALFALSLAFMVDPRSHSVRRKGSRTSPAPRHLGLDEEAPVSG